MSQRVLVTGAAGRLGRAVVTTLHEAGFDVVAADQTYNRELPVRTHVVDLRDPLSLYSIIEGCEAVAHLANHPNAYAGPSPQQLYADNVAMDMNVFQAAVDVGARKLIFASSVQVFAGERHGEDAESKPATPTPSAKKPARPSSATSSPSTRGSPAPPCASPPCSTPAGSNTSAADARVATTMTASAARTKASAT